MRIAILEIAPHGHYTYVESIALIYTAVPENEVLVFTNGKGYNALKHLENDRIHVEKLLFTEGGENGFNQIVGFDKMYVVTLEAYAKEPFRLMQSFEKTNFGCPIYYVIHNVDFWFQQSLSDKIRNIFFQLNSFKDFTYRLKVYFYYTFINPKIIQKVKSSGGKFVTLTTSVGNELAKQVGEENVAVVPFSVFDGKILAKHKEDKNPRLRVCLPGFVSGTRRDYASIFQLLAQDNDHFFKNNIEFDFLGGISTSEGGEQIRDEAKDWISKGYAIRIYDKPSVGLAEFDENLVQADLILGNMHIKQGANGAYGKSKESGLIFTMIKAAKVGLLPKVYTADNALKSSVLTFKSYDDIALVLKKIIENPTYWAELQANALTNSEKFRPLSIYNRLEKETI
jgi:hypothetical protein